MPLSTQDIVSDPDFITHIRRQARAMVELDREHIKMATAFRTQQRWQLGQLSMALYFKGGLNAAGFLQEVERLGIASRNTADTFLQQMIAFNAVQPIETRGDRRKRFFKPTDATLHTYDRWLSLHLATLDDLTRGDRVQRYWQDREAITVIQPLLADFFLQPFDLRTLNAPISPFLWSNNGFIVTDHLVMNLDLNGCAQAEDKIFTSITSIAELAEGLNMSRSNASHRLREAEAIGAIGWEDARGRSRIWLSRDLLDAYLGYQANFLSQIDKAFFGYFKPQSRTGGR